MHTHKLISLLLVIHLFVLLPHVNAQKYPTRFLGFPIDGPKSTMIENLKSKGFIYQTDEDFFIGFYYGEPVYLFINTRDAKVNRILLYDIIQRNFVDIRKRFNNVLQRFQHHKKYVSMEDKEVRISTSEDSTDGVQQYSKNYKAVFGQKPFTSVDSINIQTKALGYTPPKAIDIKKLKTDFKERLRRIHAKALMRSVSTTDDRFMNQVWLAINKKHEKYALVLSFDNLNNFTQPDDEKENSHL